MPAPVSTDLAGGRSRPSSNTGSGIPTQTSRSSATTSASTRLRQPLGRQPSLPVKAPQVPYRRRTEDLDERAEPPGQLARAAALRSEALQLRSIRSSTAGAT